MQFNYYADAAEYDRNPDVRLVYSKNPSICPPQYNNNAAMLLCDEPLVSKVPPDPLFQVSSHIMPLNYSVLVDIPEIEILSISEITECRCTKISTFQAALLSSLDLVPAVVLGFHQDPECHHHNDFDEMAT